MKSKSKSKSKSDMGKRKKHEAPKGKRSPMVPVAGHTRGGSDPRGRFGGGETMTKVAGHLRGGPGGDSGYGTFRPPNGPSRG